MPDSLVSGSLLWMAAVVAAVVAVTVLALIRVRRKGPRLPASPSTYRSAWKMPMVTGLVAGVLIPAWEAWGRASCWSLMLTSGIVGGILTYLGALPDRSPRTRLWLSCSGTLAVIGGMGGTSVAWGYIFIAYVWGIWMTTLLLLSFLPRGTPPGVAAT